MATGRLSGVLSHLRGAACPSGGRAAEGDLLARFVAARDEDAFESLVRLHGPMVLGVCRRMLSNHHDAEDAFQAAFLVLARKAASLGRPEQLANWLYGVACRSALEVKAARRRLRERQVAVLPEPAVADEAGDWVDLQPVLDQELSRLPDKYRSAVVLCDLEGRTRGDAARRLGVAEGTLSGRLTTARRMLARRLERHGVALSAAALATALSQAAAPGAVPGVLAASTIQAAAAFAAGQAAGPAIHQITVLTEGVLKAMLMSKVKTVALLVLLAAGVVGAAAAMAVSQNPGAPATAAGAAPKDGGAPQAAPEPRFENAPGWAWYSEPPRKRAELGTSMSTGDVSGRGVTALFQTDKDGALVVYLAYHRAGSALEYRPVAFDVQRRRHQLAVVQGGGHNDVRLTSFRLDPAVLPAAKAEYLGFEILTTEGRKTAAADAASRARKAGVEVLPLPEVGRAYDFTLTAADGKKLRARDLRGKVVLVDCWATWCNPCMQKMPALKKLYEKYHGQGLEIVGVCFDQDGTKGKKAIERLGLGWAQVIVPAEDKARELWATATGIDSIPRLLLIDRGGVLRADCTPGELESLITKLIAEKP
jgi:RNA polymerase sigma factor (sigma-70 family)